MAGEPLTPEQMAAFQAKFGLPADARNTAASVAQMPEAMSLKLPTSLGGTAPDVAPPPAAPVGTISLPGDAQRSAAAVAQMPEAMQLKVPTGVGTPGPSLDPPAYVPPPPKLAGPPAPPPGAAGQAPQGPPQLTYPPAQFVPGQWVGRSRVIEGGTDIPNEAKINQGAGLTSRQDAADIAGNAQQHGALKAAETLQAVADRQDDFVREQKARDAARAFKYQQAQSNYDDAVQKAANVADVDPGRFWAQRGFGPQLMATIGVALGAAGAALTGGQNTAAQLVENAIDRDLQAQRDNIAKAQGNVGAAKGVLAEMRSRFGDEQQAEYAAKDAMLAATQTRLLAIAKETSSEEARAKAMDMWGQFQTMRGQQQEGWATKEQGKIRTAEAYVPGHMVGGPPAAGAGSPVEEKDDARVVVAPDGTAYQMKTGKEGEEMRGRLEATQQMREIANRIDKLRNSVFTYGWNTQNTADAQVLKTDFIFAYQHAHGIKRLTDTDLHLINDTVGDPTAMLSRSGQRFIAAADSAERGVQLSLKANGARVIKAGYGHDEQGNAVPTQAYTAQDVASANLPKSFRPAGGGPPPRQFQSPPTKQYDPSQVAVKLEQRKKRGGGRKAASGPTADPDYVSPADEGDE